MLRLLIVALSVLAPAAVLAVQDPMSAAKELYASAAYEEALTALQVIRDSGESTFTRQAEEYRAFCLLALGRTSEAELAAEAAVRRDPLAPIDSRDASPRVEALFTTVRRRLLPSLIRDGYRAARERMNHGERTEGLQDLDRVGRMLSMARTLGVTDDTLTDLSVLVDGFLDLQRAATPPAVPASTVAPETTAPEPAAKAAAPATSAGLATPAPPAAPPPAASTPAVARVYSATDAGIVPPVAVRQDVPEVILDTSSRRRSTVIEVTIDERGNVRNAIIREPISEWVDEQLLKAARAWRYQPARRDGVAVPYVKILGIVIGSR